MNHLDDYIYTGPNSAGNTDTVGDFVIPSSDNREPENENMGNIPGLYRIMHLYKDNGIHGLVDKIILSQSEIKRFCNDVVPGSYCSEIDIDYKKLCEKSLHYIGVYGNAVMIANLLLKIKAISAETEARLRYTFERPLDNSVQTEQWLSAGIYLFHDEPSGCGLVIHWPERDSFMENASTGKKKNMINLQRYLCKLTDRQICLMSKADVAAFKWNDQAGTEDSLVDDGLDDDICFEFEVEKNQEQKEDFDFREGFKIRIPSHVELQPSSEFPHLDLHPEIIESVHHQTVITKQLIPSGVINTTTSEIIESYSLGQKLQQLIPNRKLILPSTISLPELRILVEHASFPQEISQQCFPVLKYARQLIEQQHQDRAEEFQNNVNQEIDLLSRWATKRLRRYLEETYSILPKTNIGVVEGSESYILKMRLSFTIDEFNVPSKYCDIVKKMLQTHIKTINNSAWMEMRKRLLFSQNIAYVIWNGRNAEARRIQMERLNAHMVPSKSSTTVRKDSKKPKETQNQDQPSIQGSLLPSDVVPTCSFTDYIQLVYNIFTDKTVDLRLLARSHLPPETSTWIGYVKKKLQDPIEALIADVEREFKMKSDPEFAETLQVTTALESSRSYLRNKDREIDNTILLSSQDREIEEILTKLQEIFIEHLEEWGNGDPLRNSIRQMIASYLNEETYGDRNKMQIEKEDEIATLEENERLRIRRRQFEWEFQLESPTPPKVCLSFHETRLDQLDFEKLQTEAVSDDAYRPYPQLYQYGAQKLPTLEYYPLSQTMQSVFYLPHMNSGNFWCDKLAKIIFGLLRKMYQSESGKILCFLHSIDTGSTHLYYEKAPRIGFAVANSSSFKKFHRGVDLTAYDDVSGLLALYSFKDGTLNVLCFDETRNDIFTRSANIRILPWYNNTPPELTQILFITGTENLCFIEANGRVRIYSLISGQFQPADGEFPKRSEIRCSPDGTCLIAFVRQSAESDSGVTKNIAESSGADKQEDNMDIASKDFSESTEAISFEDQFKFSNELSVDVDCTKTSAVVTPKQTGDSKLNAHVFFLKNLKVASKVVQILALGNPNSIELSFLAGRQIHFLYITSSYEYFASKILKITVERNEWRFNKSSKATTYL
ncbi:hypothetical protein BC937DRAFT_90891, partial [Endogone sp. FLAS-F59071]